ncbi:MAG TPA: lytic transglycosylase domain-containing protein [Rhizomicrobium sp.]|nr:lytic transglycosylase domain-containing protein [Rhizomicrobium sp.]
MKRALLITAAIFALGCTNALAQSVPVAVLSPDDVQRYRQIFADERAGRFDDAQSLVAQLNDRSLVGYAQAEHYLSPHSSRTPVSDLVAWMNEYNDLGVASRIYDLGIKRASVPIKRHHRVVGVRLTATIPSPAPPPRSVGGGGSNESAPGDPPLSSDIARSAFQQMLASVKADQPAQAEAQMNAAIAQGIPGSDAARLAQKVAWSYLAEGQDFDAFRITGNVNAIDRQTAPMLDWVAGLALYRLGKFDTAANHFEVLTQVGSAHKGTRAAAAFWAARSNMRAGNSRRVITLLVAAARLEPTFYGLLSERILGWDSATGFTDATLSPSDFNAIAQIPAAHRAIALYQIGEMDHVHAEMARALASIDAAQSTGFAAMAHQMNQPDLELRASELSASQGKTLTGLFPVPAYQPAGGYRVDPSLVLAFVRQESRFQQKAVSSVGATGLMQIMPGTAAYIDSSVDRSQLKDPTTSLDLGQRYIAELLDKMNNNLFQTTAAYDAGPGSVWRWMDRPNTDKNDPLLFLETMPSPEARDYVRRVMTYYWMYNRRQNEESPALDQAAAGDWPQYRRPANMPAAPAPVQQPAPTPTTTIVSDASY